MRKISPGGDGDYFCFGVLFCDARAGAEQSSLPVLNGAARYLPKPVYSPEAKEACAAGAVSVEVLIDENGDVISAAAVAGDELLRASAVEAAKKAKFDQKIEGRAVKLNGVIVYNVVPEKKCVAIGIVNKRALSIPKPEVENIIRAKEFRLSKNETVYVRVVIDLATGKVKKATAVSGNPLLRAACEAAALKAKFSPFYHGAGILVKATIAYKFKPDGTIEI